MSTTYTVKVEGAEGIETVTVSVGTSDEEEITLVDIVSEKPVIQPSVVHVPSITTTSISSISISQLTSNEADKISQN